LPLNSEMKPGSGVQSSARRGLLLKATMAIKAISERMMVKMVVR
jgi:hypothetical protein